MPAQRAYTARRAAPPATRGARRRPSGRAHPSAGGARQGDPGVGRRRPTGPRGSGTCSNRSAAAQARVPPRCRTSRADRMRRSSRGHGVLGHAPGKLRPRRTSGCTLIGVSSIDQTLTVSKSAYGHPHIQDYGSLVELTADLDLHMVGSVAKIVSLASVEQSDWWRWRGRLRQRSRRRWDRPHPRYAQYRRRGAIFPDARQRRGSPRRSPHRCGAARRKPGRGELRLDRRRGRRRCHWQAPLHRLRGNDDRRLRRGSCQRRRGAALEAALPRLASAGRHDPL